MQKLGHSLALLYGQLVPYHRGRERIIQTLMRFFRLQRPGKALVVRRGARFELDLAYNLDCCLYYWGYYDFPETVLLEANLKPGDVFIDVGANFGYYTLLAARKVAPSGEVHAFEIAREELDRLSKNVSLNPFGATVTLNRTAVSDHPGDVFISPTFGSGTTHLDLAGRYQQERVPATTLDQYVQDRGLPRVDFLKCDIEGAEPLMLKGATRLLREFRPVLLLEICPVFLTRFGFSAADILGELERQEYSVFVFARTLFGVSLRRMSGQDVPVGEHFRNVVAIPAERLHGSPQTLSCSTALPRASSGNEARTPVAAQGIRTGQGQTDGK